MDISKTAIIEFFLFASPKPVSLDQLKAMAGDMEEAEIKEAISWLQDNFYCTGRALQICEVGGGYQICTRPELHPLIKQMSNYHVRHRLSRAALEVLAIVAYKQPTTRYDIDDIRGVNSVFVLRKLYKQKLVRIVGRKDCIGHPILYGTGKGFLEYFGLKKFDQLPKETELREIISNEDTEKGNDQA